MAQRLEWTSLGLFLVVPAAAVALTAWQVAVDRSVFADFFGSLSPVVVMTGAAVAGVVALRYLQESSDFAIAGPGAGSDAMLVIAWAVPLLATSAIVADLVFGFDEDTNVAMPDALRFYPAIAVFVELVLHAVPIAILVALFGAPTGTDASLWRIALPVALIEAALQAAYATSVATAVFSAVHLTIFGVAQVWMFWRFGFIWMLGFRLAYYALWHLAWGAVRLRLLF